MTVLEKANAKINLFLDVTSRREDGFHDIKSVMQSVSLCDYIRLSAEVSEKTMISITTNHSDLPLDENNLVYKSAAKYLKHFGIRAKIDVDLEKHIPVGAGLGGGSSDAAATLRALNKIFGHATETELLSMAADLGSDVPFCLVGGTAICTGRGEKMERIQGNNYHLVISIGNMRVSTPKAYAMLDDKYNNFSSSSYTPKIDVTSFYNIFESVTDIDEIGRIKEIMIKNGAEQVLMSGSGPSVFGIFENENVATEARNRLVDVGFVAFVATSEGGNY